MTARRVTILGGGPAGLGAALGLARQGHHVTLLEQAARVGGNAGSFELAGMAVDYGSHRFHPAADPSVLRLVQDLLGRDLLERPRHGRIRLMRRWIHFPLRPVDLVAHANPRFSLGVFRDLAIKPFGGQPARPGEETFANVLERGLGRTICREFYFPYARKIWGLDPTEISAVQAHKRVSAGSIGKLLSRLVRGGRGGGARSRRGIFYYPRHGYGQISECLAAAAQSAGARIELNTSATRIELLMTGGQRVEHAGGTGPGMVESDYLWSTIPLPALVRAVRPAAPAEVLDAMSRLELRAMLLVYLVLETERFTEFDAHYFPEEGLPFTRVSEPKNYSALGEPRGLTVLCAEIPCAQHDPIWKQSEEDLGRLVSDGLARAGVPITCPIRAVTVRRLPAAYPIYRRGYDAHFSRVDGWIDALDGVLSFGRQGLFAHDNTHHALFMAQAAVSCLVGGTFDRAAWREHRRTFEQHVVED